MDNNIPTCIFIVPYRNRTHHKVFFIKYMTSILINLNYEIYFSHQADNRSFNRGAAKNIGFLAMKKKYPNHYKEITFIFNDIDCVPYDNILNYETTAGTVKHFYGFKYTLGGIVSFKGSDFEKTNGYPNYWGWGMEDNIIQKRCVARGLTIDRTNFFPIGSQEVLQLFDGVSRLIHKPDIENSQHDNGIDGLKTLTYVQFSIDTISSNVTDNIQDAVALIYYINITQFLTNVPCSNNLYEYDIRDYDKGLCNFKSTTDNFNKINENTWTDINSQSKYQVESQDRKPNRQINNSHADTQTQYYQQPSQITWADIKNNSHQQYNEHQLQQLQQYQQYQQQQQQQQQQHHQQQHQPQQHHQPQQYQQQLQRQQLQHQQYQLQQYQLQQYQLQQYQLQQYQLQQYQNATSRSDGKKQYHKPPNSWADIKKQSQYKPSIQHQHQHHYKQPQQQHQLNAQYSGSRNSPQYYKF
jgi:hypothetical protein